MSPPLLPHNVEDYFIGNACWIEITLPSNEQRGEIGTGNSKKRKKVVFVEDRQHNLACTHTSGLIAVSPETVF